MLSILGGLSLGFCFGLLFGAGSSGAVWEKRIKSGYVQVDNEIYETKVVLRGKNTDKI